MSTFVKDALPDNFDDADDFTDADREVNCPKVSGPILKKVVEFCTKYQEEPMHELVTPLEGNTLAEVVKPKWCVDFCNVDHEDLFHIVAAANFMNIKPLLELSCLAVGLNIIKGKSKDELCELFHIPPAPVQEVESNN